MSLLDKIEKSRVDIRKMSDEPSSEKVIIDNELRSETIFSRHPSYRMIWLIYELNYEYKPGRLRRYDLVYDFLEYMLEVRTHTPLYVIDKKSGQEYKLYVGVELDVRSKYHALRTLYGICMAIRQLRNTYFFVDVYWKNPKDIHNYKDYEYTYQASTYMFKEFDDYLKSPDLQKAVMRKTPFDLASHIHNQGWDIENNEHMKFTRQCAGHYRRTRSMSDMIAELKQKGEI